MKDVTLCTTQCVGGGKIWPYIVGIIIFAILSKLLKNVSGMFHSWFYLICKTFL